MKDFILLLLKLEKIIKTGKAERRYLGSEERVPVNVGTRIARRLKTK